ncbi:hypothetical protein [Peptostreptococcus sp. D1]|uniref:hypothetical protein n=1 Tax=Peptostreptococcus sp. D1 TaxID=72304 RepID=UPI0008EA1742|nr:hypothetical protein [Peptostreptococcus sp. D1]SFE66957.1 hypothetical protein SAMN02910278_01406 [Peptostreptococcus sp. D1]
MGKYEDFDIDIRKTEPRTTVSGLPKITGKICDTITKYVCSGVITISLEKCTRNCTKNKCSGRPGCGSVKQCPGSTGRR